MNLCLVVQQDTLEGENLGAVLSSTQLSPQEFVTELQSHHCIPYQLIAYTDHNSDLEQACRVAAAPYKANLGKDWYRINHRVLSQLISLFLENGSSVVNLSSVAEIYRFTFEIIPVVNREIRVRPVVESTNNTRTENEIDLIDTSHRSRKIETINEVVDTRDEIVTIIEDLNKTKTRDKDGKEHKRDRERRKH